ncbi:MAG: XdhC family protein [Gammaproteobacteria bacterium]|nr:XdhC family protein [Gammaproteobacteria bacterium]
MFSLNERVLQGVVDWLERGERVWLCTVLETWGSSPRPVGSLLALNDQGSWLGSVSGGCLEEALLRDLVASAPDDRRVRVLEQGIDDAAREQFRLPCGGRIRLLIEPLGAEDLEGFQTLLSRLRERQRVTRWCQPAQYRRGVLERVTGPGIELDGERILHTLGPQCRLLLVGAGEVARYVARFARAADFEVALCEPREAFCQGWDEPDLPVRQCLPDDLIRAEYADRYAAILTLAHDPRVDDMALLEALQGPAFYIGAMGSQKTSALRRQRLHELGLGREALARLHGPVGFAIGSKTPPEIAIAILAELVAERYRLLVRKAPL